MVEIYHPLKNTNMIRKEIQGRIDGYTHAIVEKLFENGAMICTLQQLEEAKDTNGNLKLDEEGQPILNVIKQDTNIGFAAGTIELTPEEVEELNPQPVTSGILNHLI